MESSAKLLGYPVPPVLTVLALGLFLGGVVFDMLYLWRGAPSFALVGSLNIAAGIIGGLLAAVFGFIDWLAASSNSRARRIGLLHVASNLVVIGTFSLARFERRSSIDMGPTADVFLVEVAALLLGTYAGWLGADLFDRAAMSVDDGVNLDASSSSSGRPEFTKESSTPTEHRKGR